MQSFKKTIYAVTLVTTLAFATSALADERQPGPRNDKMRITSMIKRFIVQILDDFSFPPPH